MGPGPDQFVLSRRAGEQLSRQVRYVERKPRSGQPHRRRSITRQAAPANPFKRVRFYLPQALSGQLTVASCPVITDWFSNANASSVTVYNEDGWTADAGAEGLADYCPASGRWVITLLPCAAGSS